jgi:hypothetical protein
MKITNYDPISAPVVTLATTDCSAYSQSHYNALQGGHGRVRVRNEDKHFINKQISGSIYIIYGRLARKTPVTIPGWRHLC